MIGNTQNTASASAVAEENDGANDEGEERTCDDFVIPLVISVCDRDKLYGSHGDSELQFVDFRVNSTILIFGDLAVFCKLTPIINLLFVVYFTLVPMC